MLFGHKKPEIRNCAIYEDMWTSLIEKRSAVQEAAAYVRKVLNAIDLYPEGADKKAERRELARAQKRLLGAVADYDGRRAELIDFYTNHRRELEGTNQINWRADNWPTSHDIVRAHAGD